MKTFNVLIVLTFLCYNAFTQITINQTDMPNVNDTFRLSTTTVISYNSSETGPGYVWDFSTLTPTTQRIDTFVSVTSTPITYNLVFNNFLDPNKATIAAKNPNSPSMIQQVQVTESYDFFRETSSYFSKLGFGAQINTVPTPVKYDVPERYFSFPLTYQTTDSSTSYYGFSVPNLGYYGQTIVRKNEADGWGSITTPFGTFDVIRVKSTIKLTDTIYYQTYGIGISIPRPTEYEYKWIAKNMGIPVLKITERNFTYSFEYRDSLRSTIIYEKLIPSEAKTINFFPNPASEKLNFDLPDNFCGSIEIYSINMQKLFSSEISNSNNTVTLNLDNGVYFIKIIYKNEITTRLFTVANN